jgi:sugar phosphate isomerase/epimerase
MEQIARLDAQATHWHARQAAPGRAQCTLAQGVIDFAAIVQRLKARGYAGTLCLEYVHGSWMGLDRVDCVSETVRLRDELRRWL